MRSNAQEVSCAAQTARVLAELPAGVSFTAPLCADLEVLKAPCRCRVHAAREPRPQAVPSCHPPPRRQSGNAPCLRSGMGPRLRAPNADPTRRARLTDGYGANRKWRSSYFRAAMIPARWLPFSPSSHSEFRRADGRRLRQEAVGTYRGLELAYRRWAPPQSRAADSPGNTLAQNLAAALPPSQRAQACWPQPCCWCAQGLAVVQPRKQG
jgi:hypothetical protein